MQCETAELQILYGSRLPSQLSSVSTRHNLERCPSSRELAAVSSLI